MGTVLPPHVYGLANNALLGMIRDGNNQSVVIRSVPPHGTGAHRISASNSLSFCSGESGAGKTEETKLTLQFLAEVAKGPVPEGTLGKFHPGASLRPTRERHAPDVSLCVQVPNNCCCSLAQSWRHLATRRQFATTTPVAS